MFKNLSLSIKAVIGIGTIMFFAALLAFFGLRSIGKLNDQIDDVAGNQLVSAVILAQLNGSLDQIRVDEGAMVGYAELNDSENAHKLEQSLAEDIAAVEKARAAYQPYVAPGEDARYMAQFDQAWPGFKAAVTATAALYRNGEVAKLEASYMGADLASYTIAADALDRDIEVGNEDGARASAQATATVQDSWRELIVVTIMALLAGIAVYIGTVFGAVRPIKESVDAVQRLASGDLSAEIHTTDNKDEVGVLMRSLKIFRDEMNKAESIKREQAARSAEASKQRKADRMQMASDLEESIGSVIRNISVAVPQLGGLAGTMTKQADRSLNTAEDVAAASEIAATNVQTVAASSEELSETSRDIASQVGRSAEITRAAMDEALRTNELVNGLSEAASKIGEVVALISDIASQTNLLALNATIEAARAGDAGKGFAVVANEVKNLASQTARATGDITGQITGIQQRTADAVDAISQISSTITQMSEISEAIQVSVQLQGSATQEIAQNIQRACVGASDVATHVVEVRSDVSESSAMAKELDQSTQSLAQEAKNLDSSLKSFLARFRSNE